ncbi:MAG: hypothetical protein ACLQNE_09520 [Thermoguttaceae bacterium]
MHLLSRLAATFKRPQLTTYLNGRKAGSALWNYPVGTTRLFVGLSKGNASLLFADKDGNIVASYIEENGMFETTE